MKNPKEPKKTAGSARKRTPAKSPQAPKPARQPGSARRRGTKQEKVLTMLRSRSGATVAAIMRHTGWQQHSVHGFFSGVVRKRLGLTLIAEGEGAGRVYRIAGDEADTGMEGKK